MSVTVKVVRRSAMTGDETEYEVCSDLPHNTPLEQREAHAKTLLKIADEQAHTSAGGDDEDDKDEPQKSPGA